MGAIGYSSAGGVGQEELQAANQVPGDAHFNGVRLAQHRDCSTKGLLLEPGRLKGSGVKKSSGRMNFTPTQLELFVLSSRKSMRLVNKTRTLNSQGCGQIMLLK